MSSNQLLIQLLALSSSVSQLQNLQLLNIGQQNSLFSVSPDLLNFVQGCGGSLNQLAQFASSPVNSLLINLNSNSNACLEELIQLEQLFLSGNNNLDLGNSNLNNGQDPSNSTASVDSSNSTASVDSSNSTASVDVSNSTAAASNVSANAAPVAVAQQGNAKGSANAKGKKGEKRGIEEVVKRSAGSKKQVLTGMGLAAMMVAGVFAL
ncbi:uncharacterized protein PAC_12850 [Phialocephala subalpina]|uniref:Uncharacterized protein n=1 Tax=Phialocephala subalpina TaxID=576137 RepID=A0A1L7XD56_9HELO|nr:uncharacterized protein PAC_12850 [Phialocephala subalpina]